MKKESFAKGTFILILIGIVVKILGLINRIVIARLLQPTGVGIYMMAIPTLILGITIVQLGFPVVVSKLIAENEKSRKKNNRSIVFTALLLSIFTSIIVCLILYFLTPYLAVHFLNEKRTIYPLIAIMISLPFISISGILKGYLQGMRYMSVTAYSQLIEQLLRIISAYLLVFLLTPYGLEMQVFGAMLSIAIGELASISFIFLKLYKNKVDPKFLKVLSGKKYYSSFLTSSKELMSISLPTTGNRLIGSIVYFFEPIVFSFAILKFGFSASESTQIYGHIAGMIIPMLLMPSFISVILSSSSIPVITETFYKKKYKLLSSHIKRIFLISFVPGILTTIIFLEYPQQMLYLFYGTSEGSDYLQVMAPFFIFHYIQHPLTTILQLIGKAKETMYTTLIGGILKILTIFIFVPFESIGVWGFVAAVIVNIVFVTVLHYRDLLKVVKINISRNSIMNFIFLIFATFISIYLTDLILGDLHFLLKIFLITFVYIFTIYMINFGNIKCFIKSKILSTIK